MFFLIVLLGGLALASPIRLLLAASAFLGIVLALFGLVLLYRWSKAKAVARKGARVVRTTGLIVSGDGKTFCYGDSAGTVHVIDVDSGARLVSLPSEFPGIHDITISPDGQHFATSNDLVGAIIVWAWGTWARLQRLEYPVTRTV